MRNLFLALVLANLGFAAWHGWFAAPRVAPARVASSDAVPSLTLVNEAPAAGTAREAGGPSAGAEPPAAPAASDDAAAAPADAGGEGSEAAAAASPAPAGTGLARCVSVGPFRELAQAASAAASLRNAGYEPKQRVAEGDIWVGYWVYLPGLATRDEANKKLALLQSNDIEDSYVTAGDDGYLISLGVFSEVARAARRREAVRALGLEPTVVDRTRRGTVYWVDIPLAAGQALDLEPLQTPGRITRLEQRSCDAAPG